MLEKDLTAYYIEVFGNWPTWFVEVRGSLLLSELFSLTLRIEAGYAVDMPSSSEFWPD